MALLVLILLLGAETVSEKTVRAKAALASGEYMTAAALYDELARAEPSSAEYHISHAVALIQAGRFRDALMPLARASELNPTGPTDFLTGIAYSRLGWKGAEVYFERALQRSPGNDLVILELANAYVASEEPTRAEPLLKSIPASREHHSIRARLDRAAGRHKQAIDEWDQALLYAPGDADLLLERARSVRESGDLESAEAALGKLPASAQRNLLIAEIAVERGEPDRGLMPALDAARRDPQSLKARSLAGKLLLETGRPAEAIPHLEAARALGGDVNRELRRARRYTRTP